ncbi:MAG: hypothetical protein M3R36_17020 [Bacteroidota bacterium]|nr:hypothetical protein [Bacteroidota bacterium]
MSSEEIKSILHESIENINDEDFLLSVKEIIDNRYKLSSFPKLSDWQMERILESDKQIESGNFLTNEEADKLAEEWVKK